MAKFEFNSEKEVCLMAADIMMQSLNDEEAIMPWLMCGVPDGSSPEEVKDIANSSEFEYCMSLFLDIIRHQAKNGLYMNHKLITCDSRKED